MMKLIFSVLISWQEEERKNHSRTHTHMYETQFFHRCSSCIFNEDHIYCRTVLIGKQNSVCVWVVNILCMWQFIFFALRYCAIIKLVTKLFFKYRYRSTTPHRFINIYMIVHHGGYYNWWGNKIFIGCVSLISVKSVVSIWGWR